MKQHISAIILALILSGVILYIATADFPKADAISMTQREDQPTDMGVEDMQTQDASTDQSFMCEAW